MQKLLWSSSASFPESSLNIFRNVEQNAILITNSQFRFVNIYLLPSILFAASYGVFGSYYGTSDDATVEALVRGVFFSRPVTEFFAFHRITAVVYAWLYHVASNIPWYGMLMHALLLLAVTNYFALVHRFSGKLITSYAVLTPLLIVFYNVFFLDGVIFITYTKVAILLGASSILLMIEIVKERERQKLPYGQLGYYLVLFVVAFLTRPQTGLLCIAILLPFALLYLPQRAYSRAICLYGVLISIVGFLKLYDYATSSEGSRYYWSVAPYVLSIYDYKAESEKPGDQQDVIRYSAITKGAFGDRAIINEEFLKRIADDQLFDISRLNLIGLARGVRAIESGISRYQAAVVLLIMGTAFVVFIRYRHVLPSLFPVGFIVFSFAYWSIVILIAVFWKMPDRVLAPLVVTYATSGVLLLASAFSYLKQKNKSSLPLSPSGKVIALTWIFASLVLLLAVYKKAPVTEIVARDVAQTAVLRDMVNRKLANKIVVFTFNASQMFVGYQPLFSVCYLSGKNRYLLVDGTWPTLLPEYPQRLREITGSDRMTDVFDFFVKHRDEVVFVSTPRRNAFLQQYYASLYNRELTFDEIKEMPTSSEIRFYTINGNSREVATIPADRDAIARGL